MAVKEILPSTNLTWDDIRDTLNAGGGSVTNDVASAFQYETAKFNIWSKFKPTKYGEELFTLTEKMIEDANCSISIVTSNSAAGLYSLVKGGVGFTYMKPEFYRVGDYRNYNRNAVLPAETTFKEGDRIKIGGDYVGNETYYRSYLDGKSVTGDTYQVGCKDIFKDRAAIQFSQLRRGILITNGTKTYWTTDYIDWTQTRFRQFMNSQVTLMEFYTNVQDTDGSSIATDKDIFFSLPYPICKALVTSDVPDNSQFVGVSAIAQWANRIGYTRIKFIIYVSAVGSEYRGGTITNITGGVYQNSDGTGVGQSVILYQSQTVEKGKEVALKSTLSIPDSIPNGFFYISWRMPNGRMQDFSIRVAAYGTYPEINF